jgi:hypothetical protein
MERFPQLQLTTHHSFSARVRSYIKRAGLRGLSVTGELGNKFDAVCEGPGGRIHPIYSGGADIFWAYARCRKRAILLNPAF